MSENSPYTQPVPRPDQPRRRPPSQQKAPRSIVMLAVLGLIGVGGGATAGMVYDVVVNGSDTAALISVASIAVGALASIAGGIAVKRGDSQQ